MIKVLVVVSGLVLLVPEPGPDPGSLTAIVLASKHLDAQVPEHVPAFRQPADDPSHESWNLSEPFDVKIEIAGEPSGTIGLGGWHHFLAVSDLEKEPGTLHVRRDCFEGSCKANQAELVAGRIRFEGRWRTRAASRDRQGWSVPPDFTDQVKLALRNGARTSTPHAGFKPRRIATGLVLETEVNALADLAITINGERKQPTLSGRGRCARWIGPGVEKCVILEAENWPEYDVPEECQCKHGAEIPDECKLDRHFEAFYALLEPVPAPEERWLPYVEEGYCEAPTVPGPGNPPAVRCPPLTGAVAPVEVKQ